MISLNIENDIATIEINDGKANVISKETADAFIAALDEAKEKAKVTIVRGGGDKFSAGFDLSVIKQPGEAQMEMLKSGFSLLYRLYSHPLPLIAACNGHAIGMGAFILLCCDTRIGANSEYKIGLPETAGGMPFTPLLITILREQLDKRFYTSAALQSQMATPESAVNVGFLDMVVDAEKLDATATMGAKQLMQLPTGQYTKNKLMLRGEALAFIKAELEKMGLTGL